MTQKRRGETSICKSCADYTSFIPLHKIPAQETIVDTLRLKEEVSGLFLKPVSKKDAPDYFDIVKRSMDLSTIRDKVRKIEYRNHEQFRHDVWQIQLNAHLYNNNGRNPGIQPLADQSLEICDYLLEDYGDQLAEAEKGIDR
ncbi:hypothetical protein YC2023_069273 [Brassica napus]